MQDVSQHLPEQLLYIGSFAREIFAGDLRRSFGLENLRGRLALRKPLLRVGDEPYKTAAASFSAPIRPSQ